MTFANGNGRPKLRKLATDSHLSGDLRLLAKYPFTSIIVLISAAACVVFLVNRIAGFPPLIIIGAAAMFASMMVRIRAAVFAVVFSAVISDLLFVMPVLKLTSATFVLAAYYSLGVVLLRHVFSRADRVQ